MIRLDLKGALVEDCCKLFLLINTYGECVPRSFYRRAVRSINRDFRKGLSIINKKAKVFVELPKIKPEGDGMFSQNYDKPSSTSTEITVISQDEVIKTAQKTQNGDDS